MRKITNRQVEAYKFVYIYDCSHNEAAKLMGCSRSNVTHLLLRLKKLKPHLLPSKRHITAETYTGTSNKQHITTETYTDSHNSQTLIKY